MTEHDTFRRNVLQLHGEAGAAWLARIPELLQTCAAKWALSLGAPYPGASYSYVVRAERADGTPAVLKLSFPDQQPVREAAALQVFAGRASVALFESEDGALLLQRAVPGTQLARLCERDDERATSIAARVIRTLHREAPADAPFPSVERWPADIRRACELAPQLRELASHAVAVAEQLIASRRRSVLLHGDLHQFNILAAGEAWLAIDPSGIVGEPECEIAPLLLNPIASNLPELIDRRMTQLCDEIDLDPHRAHAWTFVRTVLAILWSLEDHGEAPPEWIECARQLRTKN